MPFLESSLVDTLTIDEEDANAFDTAGTVDNDFCGVLVDQVIVRVEDESELVDTGKVAAIHPKSVLDVIAG